MGIEGGEKTVFFRKGVNRFLEPMTMQGDALEDLADINKIQTHLQALDLILATAELQVHH